MNNEILSAEKELELINNYTRSPLTADDVYIFSVTLCDNEIDRDFECFSMESLDTLKDLFVGKTGISDHSMRSKDQAARIFFCYIESDPLRKTSRGEVYTALKAKAYTVRTDSTKTLIDEIDGGIKKEVSIGCAVNTITCSICGKDMKTHSCSHIKGKTYKSKLCYGILKEPTDAYEWSFVAVPAQRNAGVTKSFNPKEEKTMNVSDIIKSMTDDCTFSAQQAMELKAYIENLELQAKEAQCYKEHLIGEISRFARIIMPSVNSTQFTENCKSMDLDSLKKFHDDMKKQAGEVFPVTSQLKSKAVSTFKSNNEFII